MRLLWLVIFAIDAWLIYDDVVAMIALPALGGVMAVIYLLGALLAAIGTLAYALNVRIFGARFWLVASIAIGVGCLWTLTEMLQSEIGRVASGAAPLAEPVVGGAVIASFLTLQWYVIFRYSRSWQRPKSRGTGG